ncbi:MAG: hypothetical protein KJN75_02930 [Muriicola sp.]|nr:hypothetical protein [Muriicola sp.]
MILVVSCASMSIANKRPLKQFPVYKSCENGIEINDFDSQREVNNLYSYAPFSYAYTYHIINHQSDSLFKEEIRNFNTTLSRYIVNKTFPEIEILDESFFKRISYSDYYQATRYLTPYIKEKTLTTQAVRNVVVPTTRRNQLFMQMSTSIDDAGEFRNYLSVYIFDTYKSRVMYHDQIKYTCDIRDTTAYTTVISYALNKIKLNYSLSN